MSARGHRDEIVALIAVIVLTALVLGGVAFFSGGDAEEPDLAAPGTESASPADSATTAAEPTAEPSEDLAPGLRIGGVPYVYACRLVPREDVERIFGAFGPEGRTRQLYLARTPTDREPLAPAARSGRGVRTSCDHTIGDPAGHTLEVDITQFPSAGALARRWVDVRADGEPVARTDDRMVNLPDRRSFLLRADPVLVEVRYSTFGDLARERPMSARERSWQERRMRAVREVVAEHLADGSAIEGPHSVNAAPLATTTPLLEPCALLTDDALRAVGAPRPDPVDVDSSYLPRDTFTDVPVSSCERRGTKGGVTTFAVLEVRVAGSAAEAREVQAKHLDNRYTRRSKARTVSTGSGQAYVADLGGFPEWPWRSRAIQMVVGPYELHLSVLSNVTDDRPYGQWVGVRELVAAADLLVSGVPEEDVP